MLLLINEYKEINFKPVPRRILKGVKELNKNLITISEVAYFEAQLVSTKLT